MLSQVINALKQNGAEEAYSSNFAIEYELSLKSLCIEIDGLGALNLPVTKNDVHQLLKISSAAKYGLREQTLLDSTVRDTQEISACQLQIQYDDAFLDMLNDMRSALGLSENTKLTAHLHNMLIYGPEQFFKPHQDSEKLEGMVATLVVVLPSSHIGGDLLVEHNKMHHRFVSEQLDSRELKCFAFYADCHHEVEKIRQGYRVALTYNLVLESAQNDLPEYISKNANIPLEEALHEYFHLHEHIYENSTNLVYFLDHEYTEHSLRWNMLKGDDAYNVLAFRSAAQKLDLVPHLALVELHETWTADGDEEDPEPNEYIDGNIQLTYWIDENNQPLPYRNYTISDEEICWTTDTEDFEPAETDFEGYMGNYGNTVDYWYRRAAVVLWRKDAQVNMDFQLNYDVALNHLLQLTQNEGREKEALEIIRRAGVHLRRSRYDVPSDDCKLLARLASYIQNEAVAQSMLGHFNLSVVDANIIGELVNLQSAYGVSWCLALLTCWSNPEFGHRMDVSLFIKNMNNVAQSMFEHGLDFKILEFLLAYQLKVMIEKDNRLKQSRRSVERKNSLADRVENVKCFLFSCSLLKEDSLSNQMIDHLISSPSLYTELALAELLLGRQNDLIGGDHLINDVLRCHVVKTVYQALSLGEPSMENWSIDEVLVCQCEHCKVAQNFLSSKTEKTKIWPIVQDVRNHIMNEINGCDLPVNLSVEKKGSPHKLVMIKSAEVYQQAKERYIRLLAYSRELSL